MFHRWGLVCALTVCAPSFAVLEMVADIEVERGVPAWNTAIENNAKALNAQGVSTANGYAECAETKEIEGAYLCGYLRGNTMNQAFARISMFIEGPLGHPKGQLPEHGSYVLSQAMRSLGGHDLLRKHFLDFYDKVRAECPANAKVCLNTQEQELWDELIEPLSKSVSDFVVISYGVFSHMPWRDVVTHEIMHAQYFMQPDFRTTADLFWEKDVDEADKKAARGRLATYYDVNDQLLLINEFQAYILMSGAEQNLLDILVGKYRTRLMDAMAKNNVSPIQVK